MIDGMPLNFNDNWSEIGRFLTDEHLFIYYTNGVATRYERRTTHTQHFFMSSEQVEIARSYYGKSAIEPSARAEKSERAAALLELATVRATIALVGEIVAGEDHH